MARKAKKAKKPAKKATKKAAAKKSAPAIALHPANRQGHCQVGARRASAGGTLTCKCASDPVVVGDFVPEHAQPCLRLHQVLEAGRRDFLGGRRGAQRQGCGDAE